MQNLSRVNCSVCIHRIVDASIGASVDVEAVWDKVAANLDHHAVAPATIKSNSRSWGYAALATAASIALIWFVARNDSSTEHGDERSHEHSALAVDFQEVIEHAKNEPQKRSRCLLRSTRGKCLTKSRRLSFLAMNRLSSKMCRKDLRGSRRMD